MRKSKQKEKMDIKNFLDMQVEAKKRGAENEKEINACQAHMWKEDTKKFYEQERELTEKVEFYLYLRSNQ